MGEQHFLLMSQTFKNMDITTFVEQMFQENAITYKFTDKIFQNSIMWLQARSFLPKEEDMGGTQTQMQDVCIIKD